MADSFACALGEQPPPAVRMSAAPEDRQLAVLLDRNANGQDGRNRSDSKHQSNSSPQ